MLLPALMVCLAMLVQPACILYTRCVMQASAAEGCRLVATRPSSVSRDDSMYTNYVLRRLSAVPDLPIFRAEDWDVEMEGSGTEGTASVRISTAVRPLPLLGVLPSLLGQTDAQGNVVLEVEVSVATRPSWVEGGYDDWTQVWD